MFNLFIIAGMLLAFGIYLLISRIKHIKNGIIVEATVVDTCLVPGTNNEENDNFFVTFKFYTLNNEEITFTENLGSDCKLQPGDKYTVAYQEYNSQDIISLSHSGPFWDVSFIFSVALILIIIATGYYWSEYYFETLTIVN